MAHILPTLWVIIRHAKGISYRGYPDNGVPNTRIGSQVKVIRGCNGVWLVAFRGNRQYSLRRQSDGNLPITRGFPCSRRRIRISPSAGTMPVRAVMFTWWVTSTTGRLRSAEAIHARSARVCRLLPIGGFEKRNSARATRRRDQPPDYELFPGSGTTGCCTPSCSPVPLPEDAPRSAPPAPCPRWTGFAVWSNPPAGNSADRPYPAPGRGAARRDDRL